MPYGDYYYGSGGGPIGGGFTFGLFGEEAPERGFAQYLSNITNTNPMRSWLSRNYQDIYQNYLGQEMSAISSGREKPSWLSFLQNYNPYSEYAYASPYERGEKPGTYTGRTRSIF